jgi:hypothetical protein
MLGDGHVHDTAALVGDDDRTKSRRHVALGTTKKSAAMICPM